MMELSISIMLPGDRSARASRTRTQTPDTRHRRGGWASRPAFCTPAA